MRANANVLTNPRVASVPGVQNEEGWDKIMAAARSLGDEVLRVSRARAPVVKFIHGPTGIGSDISLNNMGGLQSSDYIINFIMKYPHLQKFIVFMKFFLQVHDLHEVFLGGMNSFTISLLVLAYVMVDRKERYNQTEQNIDWAELILDFLYFFGFQFNYERVGISLHDGGYFYPKKERQPIFTSLAAKKARKREDPYALSIENPLDTSDELGSNVFKIMIIRKLFQDTFVSLIQDGDLDKVMRVPDQVFTRRRHLENVYNARTYNSKKIEQEKQSESYRK